MGWKELAISIYSGEKVFLESMKVGKQDSKYWIIPKKLAVDPQRRMTQLIMQTALKFKIKRTEEMTDEDVKKIVGEKIASGEIEYDPYDDAMQETLKIAFLHGVHDHNFDDDKGNILKWDEILFKQLLDYYPVLIEILQKVQEYNKTFEMPEKKSSKSGT